MTDAVSLGQVLSPQARAITRYRADTVGAASTWRFVSDSIERRILRLLYSLILSLQIIALMKLIGSAGSPYARKVRVVMAEKKIDFQFESLNVAESHSQIQQFNPLGKVPYLVLDDGDILFDSRVIVDYLDNLTPVHRLIPATGRPRAEVKVWEALADGAVDAAGLIRMETLRAPDKQDSAWMAKQQSKIEAALASMAQRLGDQAYCVDGRYSLADISVACAIGYLDWRFPQLAWQAKHPNLAAHVKKLGQRQTFLDTVPPAA